MDQYGANRERVSDARYRAPALEKGLDILELLAQSPEPLLQTEIARALDRSKNEIYRMLSTLVDRGYVSRSRSGDRYSLGLKLFATARQYSPVAELLERARPLLRRATAQAWQSCHIGVASGDVIVVVLSMEAPGSWGLAMRTGSVIGLWNTGTGRVLSAFMPDDEREELLRIHTPVTGEPELNIDHFDHALQKIRKNGFYREKSDTLLGVTNISFPIFDQSHGILAALTCPYIERVDSMRTASLDETEKIFLTVARELTGYFNGDKIRDEEEE